MPFPFSVPAVLIANGTSLSAVLEVGPGELVGIIVPNGWTAAGLSFQGSVDGTNFFNLYDNFGAEITVAVPVTTGCLLAWDPSVKCTVYLKIRSGTLGTPVNQGADRTLTAVIRKLPYSLQMG